MAKKEKGAKKANKDSAKKAKKAKKQTKKLTPKEIKTGKGSTPFELGSSLVSLYNQGKFQEIEEMMWSPKIESIEGFGVSMMWSGKKAVRTKGEDWMATHKIHETKAEGPFVGATGFAVKFFMDVEDMNTGKREPMHEVGVYTVKNGKIVREEFMYHVGG